MYTKAFDIVVNPTGSKFAKALQGALKQVANNRVFRRATVKVDRKGRSRAHFPVTINPLNKVQQFERFKAHGVSAPQYALSSEAARSLDCKTLFARTLINATNGRGIVEFDRNVEQYPRAPLYTEYIPKKAEYRFHVFGGKVIDVQEKRKKRGVEPDARNTRIRNVNNGYVYCRDDIAYPVGADALSISAVAACGYLYGAVDLIYNEKRGQCYVLEVNSRPGLMGSTLENYAKTIATHYDLWRK